MESNKRTLRREMIHQDLITTRIPGLPVPKRKNGNASGKSAEWKIRVTLQQKESETLKKRLEPSVITIEEPFQTEYSRNVNPEHINMVEEHRYKRNGQGKRGRLPIPVSE